jgi:hypothetical protein
VKPKPKPKKPNIPCRNYTTTADQMRLAFAGWWAKTIHDMQMAKLHLFRGELSRALTPDEREHVPGQIQNIIDTMILFGGHGFLVPPMTAEGLHDAWGDSLRPEDVT